MTTEQKMQELSALGTQLNDIRQQGGDLASDILREEILSRWPTAIGYNGDADSCDDELMPSVSEIVGPGGEILAEYDDSDPEYDSDFWDGIAAEVVYWVADPAYCQGSWSRMSQVRWSE